MRAVNTLQQLLARRKSVMDAIKTLWERRADAERTLADMFSERCTNAMRSPFGVTGALLEPVAIYLTYFRFLKIVPV